MSIQRATSDRQNLRKEMFYVHIRLLDRTGYTKTPRATSSLMGEIRTKGATNILNSVLGATRQAIRTTIGRAT